MHNERNGKHMALTYSLACPYIKLLQNLYWGILLYTVQLFRLPFPPKYNHFIKQHVQSCSNLMYLVFIEMINPQMLTKNYHICTFIKEVQNIYENSMNTDADCDKSNKPGEQLLNKQTSQVNLKYINFTTFWIFARNTSIDLYQITKHIC